MYRVTGPGKIKEFTDQPYPVIKASLYNFDFDDMKVTELKGEHVQWLEQHIVPVLFDGNAWIWMQGQASRVGADQYNLDLSEKRVNRVAGYLRSRGVKDNQIRTDWVGERCSTAPGEDDPLDRAVLLRCQPALPQPVPPPKPPPQPPPPPVTQDFKIRLLGGLNISKFVNAAKIKKVTDLLKWKVGPAVDIIFFEIRDDTNGLSSFYAYGGLGAGIGGYWVSSTHKGPANLFRTSKPIGVWQFEGFAHYTTAGVGPWSTNYFHMHGTPKGVDAVHLNGLKTGTTIGISLGKTLGYLGVIDTVKGPTEPW
jgi:hypothetical protein